MFNIKTTSIITIAIFATMMTVGSVVMSLDTNQSAFAKKHKHNDADQGILQGQALNENATCSSSKGSIAISCNNVGLEFNGNAGNEAAGQE